ncbi:glycosyltransferase family 2 protein [Methanobrevibacter sp. UBA212]|uniref:glycosyltransferase family 2 protein n=1 Tax=Methanobrevibacter sp. UBA212 TaxID=1915476 RepID=UPI0025D0D75B|nr:glycosyltransferase family 2 protein [Methanobrevibacter sp. UBA212]
MVKISVIIPVYNDEKHLGECLDSVSNQTLDDIEIICINDGSTDSSLEILNEYSTDKRMTIITQTNQGSAIARNKGLDIAQGEYIGFLDADDIYINRQSLEIMFDAAKKHDASMISANLKFLTPERNLISNPHYKRGTFHYFREESIIEPDEYGIPFYFYKNLYKADLIEDIRFPDLLRGQDPIFLSKVLSEVDEIYGVPIDFYGYMVPLSFDKLDSYTKKYHYICQYRQCIDILDNSELFKTSDRYMHNLMLYLNDNVDAEVYDIVCEVFDEKYFESYKSEYDSFKRSNILNKILEENTQEYFLKAKDELGLKEDSLKEYKIGLFESKMDLKEAEYIELLSENERLKKEYELEKSFNEEVTGSKSWKLMDRLRRMRG